MADHPYDERESRGGTGLVLLGGLGLGALITYLADPYSGRGRRARLKNRYEHAAHKLQQGADVVLRDATHRAAGTMAAVRGWVESRNEATDDVVLLERVRSALGRTTSHPHAVEVQVVGSHVTLSGDALAEEAPRIVACVSKVRGVKWVQDRMRLHDSSENFPSLQGGGERRGARMELMQDNWSPAWRSLAGAIGAGLTVAGWIRGGAQGLALGTTGAGILARAVVNRDLGTLVGVGASRGKGIVVQKSIYVDAAVEDVYRQWTIENFPNWMSHVREVRPIGPERHHWVVEGPAKVPVEWDSEITHAVPDRELEWRAVPGSSVDNAGRVYFSPEGEGTRVQVTICYMPPGGMIGHAIAKALGSDPKSRMDDDLMRFKSLIETGQPPRDAATQRSSRHWPFSGARH